MIILFHILYWHVTKLIHRLTLNRPAGKIQTDVVDECLFHTENKVTDTSSADAEIGLTFDPPVYCQRYAAVQQILLNEKWRGQIGKIVDFGCAELSFFKYVKSLIGVREALFVDVDRTLLEFSGNRVEPFAADFLKRRKEPLHVQVLQGSIAYPDVKLLNTDAVICIEIIEHLYPDTLDAVPHNIFYFIQPRIAVFTTPNADFNVLFPNFSGRRHYDHKFEWTRGQFEDWAHNITLRYPQYNVQFEGIGRGPTGTEHLGCCSQMAVFVHKYFNDTRIDIERLIQYNVPNDTKDCKLCSLDSLDIMSRGVCTYASQPTEPDAEHCAHCHMQYKLVREVHYPYDDDNRTQDEVIQHESEFRMYTIANRSRMYYNSEKELHEIPLYELTANRDGEFISIPDLRNVLEKAGWTIEDCTIDETLVVPCVIYAEHQLDSPELSQSPDLNFSTDVNWDSSSQWDAGSTTEIWDDAQSTMDTLTNNTKSTEPTKDTSTDVWETASSANGHSATNTTATNTKSDTLPFEMCLDDTGSLENEQNYTTEGKIELLFDSGYQMSTSSLDISPENAKEFLAEEKKHADDGMKMDATKCYKESSKSSIFIARKRGKAMLDDVPAVQRVQAPPPPPPPAPLAEAEPVEVVENGDLANNNRDREGNNYQAAEHVVQVDDNARPRPQNLDEHNENHIVLQEAPGEPGEDDDAAESLEDASREALYDPSSELSFSEDAYLGERMSFEEYQLPIVQENQQLLAADDFQLLPRFPEWLLNIHVDDEDDEDLPRSDFYSQGDGLGIHPSMVELPRSADNSSSSSSTLEDNALHDTTPRSQDTLAGVDSSLDVTYQDALDHISETNLDSEAAMGLNVMSIGVNVHQNGTE